MTSKACTNNGTKANIAGKLFELVVGDVLQRCGIRRKWHHRTGALGLLGNEIVVDWFVCGTTSFPYGLYVECKWQSSGGSTNKNLIGMPREIKQCYNLPTVIVIDGEMTKNEHQMLIREKGGKFMGAFTLGEFVGFAAQLNGEQYQFRDDDLSQQELF